MEKRLPLPTGAILQGRYRIVRQLGHGGFGAVYEAIDDEINLSFALKETFYAADDELRQAFKREARMLASLSHDAFPRVTHYFTENDGCFLVMELVYGDDLDKFLAKRPTPFEQGQVLRWADEILDALEDLHARGIIHRDIKPSNLRLTPKGKLKLLDFGIAKGTLEGETTVMTTVGSMAAATMQYAPLEQVLRASHQHQMMLSVVSSDKVSEIMRFGTDATSDLYALAATIYQLLTKTLPTDSPTRALAIWSGQKDRLIPAHEINPHISKGVSESLQRAMRLDKSERYQTASEMRQSLKEAVHPIAETKPAPIEFLPKTELATEILPNQTIVTEEITRQRVQPLTPATKPSNIPSQVSAFQPPPTPKKSNNVWLLVAAIGLPLFLIIGSLIGAFVYLNKTGIISTPSILTDAKYELAQTLVGKKGKFISLALSPDGKTLASETETDGITIWDTSSGTVKQTIPNAGSPAFSPDGKYLAYTVYEKKNGSSIVMRQEASGSILTLVPPEQVVNYLKICFSPDGGNIYFLRNVGLFDEPYKVPALGGMPQKLMEGKAEIIDLSPVNNLLAVQGWSNQTSSSNNIYILEMGSGVVKQIFPNDRLSVPHPVFSPDGKTIAIDAIYNIQVFDIKSVNPKLELKGHKGVVWSMAFSPDGKLIASASFDKTVNIWDAESGKLKQTLTGHDEELRAVAFSSDGKTIASGDSNNTFKLWRMK